MSRDEHSGHHAPGVEAAETLAASRRTPPRLPITDRLISQLTAVVLLLCLYSLLCMFLPAALGVRANPASMPAGSKPDWYFLFLYQYVRLVPGFIGALTPALLILLLAVWPYIDRNPSRDPRKRILALALVTITVATILSLTYLGWVG